MRYLQRRTTWPILGGLATTLRPRHNTVLRCKTAPQAATSHILEKTHGFNVFVGGCVLRQKYLTSYLYCWNIRPVSGFFVSTLRDQHSSVRQVGIYLFVLSTYLGDFFFWLLGVDYIAAASFQIWRHALSV